MSSVRSFLRRAWGKLALAFLVLAITLAVAANGRRDIGSVSLERVNDLAISGFVADCGLHIRVVPFGDDQLKFSPLQGIASALQGRRDLGLAVERSSKCVVIGNGDSIEVVLDDGSSRSFSAEMVTGNSSGDGLLSEIWPLCVDWERQVLLVGCGLPWWPIVVNLNLNTIRPIDCHPSAWAYGNGFLFTVEVVEAQWMARQWDIASGSGTVIARLSRAYDFIDIFPGTGLALLTPAIVDEGGADEIVILDTKVGTASRLPVFGRFATWLNSEEFVYVSDDCNLQCFSIKNNCSVWSVNADYGTHGIESVPRIAVDVVGEVIAWRARVGFALGTWSPSALSRSVVVLVDARARQYCTVPSERGGLELELFGVFRD